ncbi:Uncharacterised protein [Paenibacillus thiaminolyticus]|nr:Uncharacterised protein [Paenibacillus thiaminolyticus]
MRASKKERKQDACEQEERKQDAHQQNICK